jgi:hypothetical protein
MYCFGPALNNVLEEQHADIKNNKIPNKINKLYLGRTEPKNTRDPGDKGQPIQKLWYY